MPTKKLRQKTPRRLPKKSPKKSKKKSPKKSTLGQKGNLREYEKKEQAWLKEFNRIKYNKTTAVHKVLKTHMEDIKKIYDKMSKSRYDDKQIIDDLNTAILNLNTGISLTCISNKKLPFKSE